MTQLFNLHSVSVRFGPVNALTACTLRIQAGERLALVGSNGSGKSTMLRTLHGLIRPVSGSCQQDAQARQAMLFQRPYMLRASVLHNVALGLWLGGLPWKQAAQPRSEEHTSELQSRVGLVCRLLVEQRTLIPVS